MQAVETWMSALVRGVIRRGGLVLILYLGLAIASVFSIVANLRVDTDSSKMLSSQLPFQQRTQKLNQDFPAIKNSIVVVVRSDLGDAADAVAGALLEALQNEDAIESGFAPSVDPFFQTNGLLYQSVAELEASLNQLNRSASLLANLRQDPSLGNFWHSLLTAEELARQSETDTGFLDDFYGDVTGLIRSVFAGSPVPLSWAQAATSGGASDLPVQRLLYLEPNLEFSRLQPAKPALLAVEKAIASLDPELARLVSIGVTGDPALRFDELQSVQDGIFLSLGLSLLLVALLLWLAFRRLPQVLVTMSALVLALLLTTGLASLFFSPLNLVSVAFVVLLVGLGLDYSIHVIAHLDDANTPDIKARLRTMAKELGFALSLSFLTTAIAFLSFTPTDFTGIAQLGGLGAVGVGVAFLLSITFIPAILSFFPVLGRLRHKKKKPDRPSAHKLNRVHKPFAIILLLVCAGLAVLARDVRFDADPAALRNPESPSMRTLNWLAERPDSVPYRLSLERANEEAAVLAASEVEDLESVRDATTLTSFVPRNQEDKFFLIDLSLPTFETIVSGEGLQNIEIPESQTPLEALRASLSAETNRAEAQALAEALDRLASADEAIKQRVEREIFRFFPDLLSTIKAQLEVDTVTFDTIPDAIRSRYVSAQGRWRVDVVPAGDISEPQTLRNFVEEVEAYDAQASGAPLQIVKAGETVSGAILAALIWGSFGILVLTFLLLRSPARVLAIFLPLCMAAIMTAGASVLFAIPFNYANVIVLPLLVGLGVDSGIHIALRREQSADSQALFQTSTPRAILFSGLTTIAAFATLSVSPHQGTASMGQMLAISITLTLVCTIVITPLLIDFFEKKLR